MLRVLVLVAVCLLSLGLPAWATETAADETSEPHKLNANMYVTLSPFVVPLVDAAEPRQQYLLRMAIALRDEDDRDAVVAMMPRIRQEIYDTLFRQVSFRTRQPRIPPEAQLKRDILDIVHSVLGTKLVTGIVFLQSEGTHAPH